MTLNRRLGVAAASSRAAVSRTISSRTRLLEFPGPPRRRAAGDYVGDPTAPRRWYSVTSQVPRRCTADRHGRRPEWVTAEQYLRELPCQRSDGRPEVMRTTPELWTWYAYRYSRRTAVWKAGSSGTRRTARSLPGLRNRRAAPLSEILLEGGLPLGSGPAALVVRWPGPGQQPGRLPLQAQIVEEVPNASGPPGRRPSARSRR